MGNIFEKGDPVLLDWQNGRSVIILDGDMVKLPGGKGSISTSKIVGAEPGVTLMIGSIPLKAIRPDILDHIENLDRGAQMIIPKDSSQIVMGLGLSSGSRVIEGGAGSGGLTIALLNAVAPGGHVYTFDIRDDHLEKARKNVTRAGLAGYWTGSLGDITSGIGTGPVDAVVLDIPEPERAVITARNNLRKGGRFCAYIPTVNQMEKVFHALVSEGFSGIRAMEIIQRYYSVKNGAVRPATEMLGHTGFLVFARWSP